ncbi:hypothetical protein CFAM422_002454 [Trichoderma lentiforme]|uniref:Uncharacterized protein n=1 Tax=Trichoderma lentiforme TaxID=1567552 RepID=A0A9P4XP68_9HYPO|nr:hypothetical protein CFAM422_002454 [Trichoderma lentiforme]
MGRSLVLIDHKSFHKYSALKYVNANADKAETNEATLAGKPIFSHNNSPTRLLESDVRSNHQITLL